MEFRPRNAHGVEGVDVEDVEATASIHQHLGEVLLMDDGVDDEQVSSQSGDVGRMVSRRSHHRRCRQTLWVRMMISLTLGERPPLCRRAARRL